MTATAVEPHKLGTAKHALKFILAGNATFTLRSVKTGTRFTYRVTRVCCDACKKSWAYGGIGPTSCKDCPCHTQPGKYFVGVLSGPDNTRDYRYLGMLSTDESGRAAIHSTRNSKVSGPSAVAIAWFLSKISADVLPDDVEVWHAGSCGMCGRKLTVPSSIAIGIGPDCFERWA